MMVPDSTEQFRLTAYGRPGFLVLQRTLQGDVCVSSSIYPVIHVVTGNVRGACQMLPDPDWKAEASREIEPELMGETRMMLMAKLVIGVVRFSETNPI